jgi:hypothetical protein
MARDSKSKASSRLEEQEEMTVVILRFKGGGETLRKGFSTVSEALATLGPGIPQRRLLNHSDNESSAQAKLVNSDEEAEEIDEGFEESASDANGSERRGPRKPKYLSDLKLSPDGQMAWKEYATEKNPNTVEEKYLVAAAWLTLHGGVDIFKIDHVFTCFRAMEWDVRKDFSQPMRQLRADKSYFELPKKNHWKLTEIGLAAADKLPSNDKH